MPEVGMDLSLTLIIFLKFRNLKLSSLNDKDDVFREMLQSSSEDSQQMKTKKVIRYIIGHPNYCESHLENLTYLKT